MLVGLAFLEEHDELLNVLVGVGVLSVLLICLFGTASEEWVDGWRD